MRIIYPKLSYQLNGIFFEVQNRLGRFSTEKQYSDGIEELLKERRLNFIKDKRERNFYSFWRKKNWREQSRFFSGKSNFNRC